MAKVMVGIIAYRREDGSFLPSKPIYRDIPNAPEDPVQHYPLEELTEFFAKKYMEFLRAKRRAENEQRISNSLQNC